MATKQMANQNMQNTEEMNAFERRYAKIEKQLNEKKIANAMIYQRSIHNMRLSRWEERHNQEYYLGGLIGYSRASKPVFVFHVPSPVTRETIIEYMNKIDENKKRKETQNKIKKENKNKNPDDEYEPSSRRDKKKKYKTHKNKTCWIKENIEDVIDEKQAKTERREKENKKKMIIKMIINRNRKNGSRRYHNMHMTRSD